MIELTQLRFSYAHSGKPPALDGIDLCVTPGEIAVLTGPSGSGKSSALYLAAGIYPHHAGVLLGGSVRVCGEDPALLAPDRRTRLVGMMFQNPDLQFCMDTVENELAFCLENIGAPPERIASAIPDALDFCRIGHLRSRRLNSLSGGEKQRAMLACLVAIRPDFLLLDEPFANLDDDAAEALAHALARMRNAFGTGILAVDHRLNHWMGITDRVWRMSENGLCPLEAGQLAPQALDALGVIGPGTRYRERCSRPAAKEATLCLRGVRTRSGHVLASGMDASFARGRAYAILGKSGCGKSTLLRMLAGFEPHRGEILLDGRLLKRRWPVGRVGLVTQSPQDQFVSDSVLGEIRASGMDERAAERLLAGIALQSKRRLSPYLLSQGQQRRLGVAAMLACGCEVLLADEPSYAQDLQNTRALMDALSAEVDRGVTLIFTTHDRQLARDYADQIYALEGGRLHEIDSSAV